MEYWDLTIVSTPAQIEGVSNSMIDLDRANLRMARLVRKDLLPHGAQARIAARLRIDRATVSRVMNDKLDGIAPRTIERVRREIARRIKLPVEDVFPAQDAA